MKKSPLSTPGRGQDFHYGRNFNRGYSHHQRHTNNNNQCVESNSTLGNSTEANMIPLDSSSPIKVNQRNNWRHQNKYNHHFHKSGPYNNHKNNVHTVSKSPNSFQTNQSQNFQKKNPHWYRDLPISEFINMQNVFADPWANLENNHTYENAISIQTINNSVEILYEKNKQDLSSQSISDSNNISFEESRENSSLDLQLDNMNFSSKNSTNTTLSETPQDVGSIDESVTEK